MPVTAADLQQLRDLAQALVRTVDAQLAQLKVEEQQNLKGDYPAPRTLTRQA